MCEHISSMYISTHASIRAYILAYIQLLLSNTWPNLNKLQKEVAKLSRMINTHCWWWFKRLREVCPESHTGLPHMDDDDDDDKNHRPMCHTCSQPGTKYLVPGSTQKYSMEQTTICSFMMKGLLNCTLTWKVEDPHGKSLGNASPNKRNLLFSHEHLMRSIHPYGQFGTSTLAQTCRN